MNSLPETSPQRSLNGLRVDAFAALVMVLIQYALGMWINLGITLPAGDHGSNLLVAVGRAFTNGPIGVTLHALVGVFLVVRAIMAAVRAVRLGIAPWIALTAVAFVAIVLAAVFGARFVGTADNGASLVMALCAAVAIFCYAAILFRTVP